MREALIQIRADSEVALDEAFERAAGAMRSGNPVDPVAVFTFSSPAQLFSVITPKTWELIEHLQKIGSSGIRGLARSVNATSNGFTTMFLPCRNGASLSGPRMARFGFLLT